MTYHTAFTALLMNNFSFALFMWNFVGQVTEFETLQQFYGAHVEDT